MRLGITGGRVSTPASLPGDSLPAARNPTRRSNQRTRRSATSHCVSGVCCVLHGMRMHEHVCGVGVGVRACVRLSVCASRGGGGHPRRRHSRGRLHPKWRWGGLGRRLAVDDVEGREPRQIERGLVERGVRARHVEQPLHLRGDKQGTWPARACACACGGRLCARSTRSGRHQLACRRVERRDLARREAREHPHRAARAVGRGGADQ